MAVDIEPLLQKLTELAPRFGRAQEDLQAIVSRGRAHDYKGVMQNARLVLEALLRSLVTEELKQTPGKAMLDELVTKFRQQANAGIIPTNVLAHMGTVQAWGNLSAHDHAGSLEDSGVKVGQDEVVASLNSMVAILSWYAEKKALPVRTELATPLAVKAVERAAPAQPRSKLPLFIGLGVAALGGIVAVIATRPNTTSEITSAPPKSDPFIALDAVYATRKEPVPPVACRRAEEAPQLAKSASDAQALALIERPSAEAAYLLARVSFEELKRKTPALDVALACDGFAAAQHLAGLVAISDGNLPEAQKRFQQARATAPSWLDNRAKLAGVLLQTDQRDAASKEIDGLVSAAPDYAPAYLLRFSLEVMNNTQDLAMADLCKAMALGSAQARDKVDQLHFKCP